MVALRAALKTQAARTVNTGRFQGLPPDFAHASAVNIRADSPQGFFTRPTRDAIDPSGPQRSLFRGSEK